MSKPILVIDVGAAKAAAVLVTSSGQRLQVGERNNRPDWWPSAVRRHGNERIFGTPAASMVADPRLFDDRFLADLDPAGQVRLGDDLYQKVDLLSELMRRIRTEAERLERPVSRMLLTVSPDRHEAARDHPVSLNKQVVIDDKHRQALLKAAKEAKFEEVEFLPQPVATVLAAPEILPAEWGDVLICDAGATGARVNVVRYSRGPRFDAGRSRVPPQRSLRNKR